MNPGNPPNKKRKRDGADDATSMLAGRPFDNTRMEFQQIYHRGNTTPMSNQQSPASSQPVQRPNFIIDPSMRMNDGNTGRSTGSMLSNGSNAPDITQHHQHPQSFQTGKPPRKKHNLNLTPDQLDAEDQRIFREKNAKAAQRCRERKKELQARLEEEARYLRLENRRLIQQCELNRANMEQMHMLAHVHEQCDHPDMRTYFAAQTNPRYHQVFPGMGYQNAAYNIPYPSQGLYYTGGPTPGQMHPQVTVQTRYPQSAYPIPQPAQQPTTINLPTNSGTVSPTDSGIVIGSDAKSSTQTRNGTPDTIVIATPSTERQAPSNPDASTGAVDGADVGLLQDGGDDLFPF